MTKNSKISFSIVLAAALLFILWGILNSNSNQNIPLSNNGASSTSSVSSSDLPGLITTDAPWPPEIVHLHDRLNQIGLPALSQEGTVLHIHQHLDIFIHGLPVQVPENIGINHAEAFLSPIHVHDTTGIIHVESPTVQTYTLGQFFDVWGLRFASTTIGGYQADSVNSLQVYVDGKKVDSDPRNIELKAHDEIAVTFGTTGESAKIPASFAFPPGY